MASPRPRIAVTLLSIAALAAVLVVVGLADGATCGEAISEATARSVFDGLAKLSPAGGCTLENVATERSEIRVEWKKAGHVEEAIVVLPTSCSTAPQTGRKLATVIPASVATACPAAAESTRAFIETLAPADLVRLSDGPPVRVVVEPLPSHRRLYQRLLAGGVAAVAAGVLAFLGLRRWARREPRAGRPRWQRNPSRAGWGAAALIAPHLALGTWLLIVPDHAAFTTAQVVTLAHVGLALLGLPFVAVWTLVHVTRMRTTRPRGDASSATNKLLTGAVMLAVGTGFAVLVGGDTVSVAPLHAACGVAVGVPLALHLWFSTRKGVAWAVASTLVVTALGAFAARRWLPATTPDATVPAFAYTTRDASLYEPAANCGECHVQEYADWKRSTHARTLELTNVQDSLGHASNILGETLISVGQLRTDPTPPADAAVRLSACSSCHAPTKFYGDDKQSMLAPAGVVAEGVGCSFCHTLRAAREFPLSGVDPRALSPADVLAVLSHVPLYVSAPETVRRYLFQGSHRPLARRVANLLIRWRPEVHSRDYDAKVLGDSRACLACHSLGVDSPKLPHMTYFGWKESSFVTGDPKTTVDCQDCHMTRHMTGAPASDPGRMVPWGPTRPRTRSQLLLGGNVRAATGLGDGDLARQEHALNAQALTLSISHVERVADVLDATLSVQSNLVGHYFPALETQLRYGWVELEAVDSAGKIVASTPAPRDSQDFGCPSPFIMSSVDDPKPGNQRLVPARTSREFRGHVTVPPGAAIEKLVAVLHESVDPTPIAAATWRLR